MRLRSSHGPLKEYLKKLNDPKLKNPLIINRDNGNVKTPVNISILRALTPRSGYTPHFRMAYLMGTSEAS